MSTMQPSVAATPDASRRGASPGVDPREADALRGAIERLGGRLETTRDMLDRLALQAADAGRTEQREAGAPAHRADPRPAGRAPDAGPVAARPTADRPEAAPSGRRTVPRAVPSQDGPGAFDVPAGLLAHVVRPVGTDADRN